MSELMLVNPRRRKRRAGAKRRRKMTAKQLQYFGPKRRRHRRRRAAVSLLANPRRHHRRRSRRVHHMRRNPRRLSGGGRFSVRRFMNDALIPAGIGAVGALGVNIALGYITPSLPVSLQSGIMNTGVKIAGAVAIGMAAGMVAGKRFGEQAMAGAITVTLYDLLKGYAASAMPTLPLSGYHMGWVSPAYQVGEYVGVDRSYTGMHGMGMYVGETERDYYRY